MVILLRYMGRVWWCACGQYSLTTGDPLSAHTSQHVLDPYSFTHILHGVLFCGIFSWLFSQRPWEWRFSLAVLFESFWELIENSQFAIQRYRVVTSALGYQGDSISNSLGDMLSCMIGFQLAWVLGFRRSVFIFFLVEMVLLLWIKDCLILNIIMLVFPMEAIKAWQLGN
jgi:hypothetical protein